MLVLGASLAAEASAQQQAQPQRDLLRDPIREIEKIKSEVYRFRNNFHYSVFAVTPQGAIVTDPINKGAAEWLKNELRTRFGVSARYLIYSHDHADHISGGEVFADTAVIIAHENAKTQIVGEKRPTAVPQITFGRKMTIELGGTSVELIYTGRNHSDNSIVMRFPAEKIAFAVDFIPVNSVAFRDFPDAYISDWIRSLKFVEMMDFDILAPGHGPLGDKNSVRAYRGYMEDLRDQVLKLAREGKSLEDAKKSVNLEKYKTWMGFEQMSQLNIEGMYRYVQTNRRGN
jgi:glyoxylase-like metal-dependent hydrolase (beta-lactamase superfamily II)